MADDPDVRGAGAQRVVADHRLQRVTVPRLADDRGERVPLTGEDLQDLSELLLEHEPALVHGRVCVGVIDRVADLGDQALAGTQPAGETAMYEARIGLGERSADVTPRRTFASLPGRSHENAELVRIMVVRFDRVVRAASARGSERDKELREKRHRVCL
jgi:hypothetical protein